MAYQLQSVTIKTNNTPTGMAQIDHLWRDIASGTLPLVCDSQRNPLAGVILVSKYHSYHSDKNGDYRLRADCHLLQELERSLAAGSYKKYEVSAKTAEDATKKALATGVARAAARSGE